MQSDFCELCFQLRNNMLLFKCVSREHKVDPFAVTTSNKDTVSIQFFSLTVAVCTVLIYLTASSFSYFPFGTYLHLYESDIEKGVNRRPLYESHPLSSFSWTTSDNMDMVFLMLHFCILYKIIWACINVLFFGHCVGQSKHFICVQPWP